MNILLTNDDGYQSVGLQQLCEGLGNLEGVTVYVVAPDSQRSGYSHSMEFHKPVSFVKLDSYHGAELAYISSGTPANCTNFGLQNLGLHIDFVISGPNAGPNYGFDVLYSGTVGGAEEAVVKGYKGMAVSLNSFDGSYNNTVKFVVENIDKLYSYNVPDTVLNVNVPNVDVVKGVTVAKQSNMSLFTDHYIDKGDDMYLLDGSFNVPSGGVLDDATLCNEGYITLTSLSLLRTNDEGQQAIKDIFKI